MYVAQNGWTKARMIEQIKIKNKGAVSRGIGADGKTICLYRSENSNCCAVGAFIPDELYDPKMENRAADCLARKYSEVKKVMPLENRALWLLQQVHDKSENDPRPHLIAWINENVKDPDDTQHPTPSPSPT